ncbi:MAG: hypothetical protein M1821_005018 [Bathelium mastoideum]|nr:MAG: hypothetical protein M1821_005018 [Bathelium mastoideum]
MQLAKIALAVASVAGLAQAVPGGVSSAIAPSQAAPPSCAPTYTGTFNIATVNVSTASSKRDLEVEKRQASGTLTLSLNNGVLHDQIGRTGYIASNYQFQFDNPPQAGAIYTAGFSVCGNGSIALGNSAIFYACYSGGFYNLYNTNWAPQCSAIYIQAVAGGSSGQGGDGQPTAGSVVPSVTEKSEGQPGATSVAPSAVSEKSEGQPVATTVGTVVTEATDGQPALPTAVSQISDGQPQAPSPVTVSVPIVSEKSEGQPVASSAVSVSVVSSLSSGAPVVSEKSEGQPVASSAASSVPVVSEKSEGQPVATGASNGTITTPTASAGASSTSAPLAQTSAGANQVGYNVMGLAAGVVGAMALL